MVQEMLRNRRTYEVLMLTMLMRMMLKIPCASVDAATRTATCCVQVIHKPHGEDYQSLPPDISPANMSRARACYAFASHVREPPYTGS